MKNGVLFLTLKVFSATGGIEKVSRLAAKAFYELCQETGRSFNIFSLYDRPNELDQKYIPATVFNGFEHKKAAFLLQCIRTGKAADTVVLSHINLLSVGYLLKKISPTTKLVLLAHGIEVWEPLPAWKRRMLRECDLILSVSRFTRETMLLQHGLAAERVVVVNNGLDPFLPRLEKGERSLRLLQRYDIPKHAKIILTLTRLSSYERYKGYDEVIMAIKALRKEEPLLRYLIVGRYDAEEKARLDRLVRQQGMEKEVVFAGFVPDEELAEHFGLADVYAMPSRGEGFGIVFIEALFYGLPVIAGNADGSPDALGDGDFGWLVNPFSTGAIAEAIREALQREKHVVPSAETIEAYFGFAAYKHRLEDALGLSVDKPRLPEAKETGERQHRRKQNAAT